MSDKQIQFIGTDHNTLFTIPDGGNVIVTHSSGEQHVMTCNYVDENHFETEGARYSHYKYAAMLAGTGASVAPETSPVFNEGYRIVARSAVQNPAVVLGHAPHRRLPWVTWQAESGRDTPTEYTRAIFRPEHMEAMDDLVRRGRALRQGVPYQVNPESDKQIRFITPQYKTLFTIPDGGSIVISYLDGEERVTECKFLDECHTAVDGECYHICQFAEILQKVGATYEPETAPQFVDGYHVVRLRTESDKMIVLCHNPGAEMPWVTLQADDGKPLETKDGHFYSKGYNARKDFDRRTWAVRDGRPCDPFVPNDGTEPKRGDRGVPG